MAFLDFGLTKGLGSYRYDYDARFRRQREQAEYYKQEEEQKYQRERETETDRIRNEQYQLQKDDRIINMQEVLYDKANVEEYNHKFQKALGDHISTTSTEIGEIINTPGWSEDPEQLAEYNKAYAKAMNMEGIFEYQTAQDNYDLFLNDLKKDGLTHEEENEVRLRWDEYQNNPEIKHFNYSTKPDFSVNTSIKSYLGTLSAKPEYNKAKGINEWKYDSDLLDVHVQDYISNNEAEVQQFWDGLGKDAKGVYVTKEKLIETVMKQTLGDGKETKASSGSKPPKPPPINYFHENIVNKTGGSDPAIINFIPYQEDGALKILTNTNKIFFPTDPDPDTGERSHGPTYQFPEGTGIFITNEGFNNIKEWSVIEGGSRYAKVQMFVTDQTVDSKDVSKGGWSSGYTNETKEFFEKNNIKFTYQENTGFDEGQPIYIFEGWIHMNTNDSRKQKEFNNYHSNYDPMTGSASSTDDGSNLDPNVYFADPNNQ